MKRTVGERAAEQRRQSESAYVRRNAKRVRGRSGVPAIKGVRRSYAHRTGCQRAISPGVVTRRREWQRSKPVSTTTRAVNAGAEEQTAFSASNTAGSTNAVARSDVHSKCSPGMWIPLRVRDARCLKRRVRRNTNVTTCHARICGVWRSTSEALPPERASKVIRREARMVCVCNEAVR